jgi:DNA modification methylase
MDTLPPAPEAALAIVYRPASELRRYEKNARTHSPAQLEQIRASMRAFGWTNPVLIDEHDGLIAGHGRLEAAEGLWLEGVTFPRCPIGQVPTVCISGLTEAERRALILADNQIALNAGWNLQLLGEELRAIKLDGTVDIGLTGFSASELAALLKPPAPPADPDAVPGVEKELVSRPGDVWILGDHRLGCGDSTDVLAWEQVMDGVTADLVWTDPPYNVAYESKLAGSIKNDSMADAAFRTFLLEAFSAVFTVMAPGAAIYVAHADTEGLNFRAAFQEAGFKLSGCLIWQKDSLVLGRSDFQWMHEPILYGWKPGARHRWYGGRKQTTVIEHGEQGPVRQRSDGSWVIEVGDTVLVVDGEARIEESRSSLIRHPKPSRSADHPTMKPVELVERFLRLSAKAGEVVVDAFGGSGSTLIAAERLAMRARLMELDPKFCDVIVRRWQQFTGGHARLAADGRSFAEVAAHARA